MSHGWYCYRKREILSKRLLRNVSLDEVHLLCEELGFTNPEETMAYIETAPITEIEWLIIRAKRRKRRGTDYGGDYIYEYSYTR